MSTAPGIRDSRDRGAAAPAGGPVTLWRLLAVVALLVNGGCRTPSLAELQRQAGLAAEPRIGAAPASIRVRQGEEIRTAPEVIALVQGELDEAAMARVALINNPELAVDYANLGIARSAVLRAGRVSNPEVETSWRLGNGGNDSLDIKAVQDLVDLALLPRRREAAARSLEAAKDRLTSRIMDVARAARTTFSEYQAAMVLLEQKQKLVECRELAQDVGRRMVAAGNMAAVELAVIEQRYHVAQLELAALQSEAKNKREAGNQIMGLHEDSGWKGKPASASASAAMVIPTAEPERTALTASLELAAQRQEIMALAQQRGIERVKACLPELKAGVDSERDADGTWVVGPALVLTLPLFDQGQAARAAVDTHLQASWNRYARTAVAVASATRLALTRLETSQQALRTQREAVVPRSTQIMHETLLQYNGMFVGVFDLLRAKEQEIEAEARLAELARDCRLAQLDLQHLLAGGAPAAGKEMSMSVPVQDDRGEGAH